MRTAEMEALREPGGQEKYFIAFVDGFESYTSNSHNKARKLKSPTTSWTS